MTVEEIERKFITELRLLEDASSQCEYLLSLGQFVEDDPSLQVPENRLAGCKTAIWLRAGTENGSVYFEACSDSLLVRGALYIMKEMYEGQKKNEVAAHPPLFPAYISDEVLYVEIKENGLKRCFQKIIS